MTRLPELERELVAAAGRLQPPRRMARATGRWAVAAAAGLAVVALAVAVLGRDDGDRRRTQPVGAFPFLPNAKLEDMLGIFRRPATEADHMGFTRDDFDEITDRQPGEDPTRSRRVRWPDATIFLWPMRNGVCDSVGPKRGHGSGGGCVPLDHLRRRGISVGIHGSGRRRSVYGIVVDGIREVVLAPRAGPRLHVEVTDNFFFVDLAWAARKLESPGWDRRVARISWRYAGRQRSFDLSRVLPPTLVPPPPPDIPDGAPRPNVDPIAESVSEPLEFAVAGALYRAVGFQTRRKGVCVSLTNLGEGTPEGSSCLSERILRDELKRRPAHVFSAGGGGAHALVHTGFARSDVVELMSAARESDLTVVLSRPWRPEPWEGEPIRFLLVFDQEPGRIEPRSVPRVSLRARLRDGRTVRVQ